MSVDLRAALAKSLGRTYVPQPGKWTHPRCPNWSVGEHLLAMEATCDLCAPAGCCLECKDGDHEYHAPLGACSNPTPGSLTPYTCPCPNGQDPERVLEIMGSDMRSVIRELRAEYAERLNESARGTNSIFDPDRTPSGIPRPSWTSERPFVESSTPGTPPALPTQGTL